MKKIRVVIYIVLFLIVLLIGILVIVANIQKNKNEDILTKDKSNIVSNEQENGISTADFKAHEIDNMPSYKEFYTVDNCISQYLETANVNNPRYYGKNDNGEYALNVNEDEVLQITRQLTNNSSNIELYKEKRLFTPIKIIKKYSEKINTFVAYGIISNSDMKYIKDAYFAVSLDIVNKTFSVDELNENGSSIESISVAKVENINKNEYNNFLYQEIDEQFKYKQIFNNFKSLMLIKPDIAYSLLDEEYKQKRFGSYEYFENYINSNREHLRGITPKSFKVNENNTRLQLKDQYSNWYEFNIKNTMEYTVKIDNYIYMFDDDIQKYNSYDEKKKINYNIERWIKMLNSKDYYFAYNYLDETFKQQNYKTLEEFTQFMQSKYPDYYDLVSINTKQEGNVYTSEVELSVEDDEYADKYMTIIIKLKEGTDFVLSFDAQ